MGKSKKTTLSTRPDNDDLKVNVLSGDPPFFTELQLEKLCSEFGIDWDASATFNWRRLAEKLAQNYHPDFNRRSPGRPGHKRA